MTDILELIQQNQLVQAVEACKSAVRQRPSDIEARGLLCQLFCFQGEWARADVQLATIEQQNQEMAVGVGLLRQLVRGEIAREQFFSEGRTPELVTDVPESIEMLLKAVVSLRENKCEEVTTNVAEIRKSIPVVTGVINGQSFSGVRDLDDLMSGSVEVITTSGKYFLIPFESLKNLEIRPPERLQDRIWRSANIEVEDGMTGEVYLPTRYCQRYTVTMDEASEALQIGAETDWMPLFEGGPVVGIGQKMFLIGDQTFSIMEIESLLVQADVSSEVKE